MPSFIHLHNHSHYSILDGITKIDELVKQAKNFGHKSIALTDHGNMFGAMEFYLECKSNEIKPIFGVEFYIAPESRFDKNKDEKYYHLILLAKDIIGFKNLIKLTSIGYLEGFYYRPRIDKQVLKEHSKGLIAMTACVSGEIPTLILNEKEKELNKTLDWYIDIFGKENFFLEIQYHKLPEEKIIIEKMKKISKERDLKIVATTDSHYLNKEDAILQEISFAIRDKTTLNDPNRYKFYNNEFYLYSPQEMENIFAELPEALSNTLLIDEMCHVNLKEILPSSPTQSKFLPQYPVPENETLESFFEKKCFEGLNKRFDNNPPENYITRLKTEIELIKKMGFANYFLIVQDFVQHAKDIGIIVGPGRGSAAGSLVSYVLNITNIDPIKYNLLFERFLNPERITMPDIDIDFQDDRRDEIKEYIRSKYGNENTANIITFGVLKSRAALKDVGRVLEIPLETVNKITKKIDDKTANEETLSTIVEKIPELKELYTNGTEIEKKWIEYSIKLEGTIRDIGTHASGIVISNTPLFEIIPLYKDSEGVIATQYDGNYLELNGLLKMDILGLGNLTLILDCLKRIKYNHNISIDMDKIPLDNQEVFKLFGRGETNGIFQFESDGMKQFLKELKPTCIDDLIAMNALFRPGPISNIPLYISRKHGKEKIDTFHKDLENVLSSTYGVIVYQEQVMQIAQIMAGFTLAKADMVRRIMAKKKKEDLEKIRPEWIQGFINKGHSKELAEKLFEILVPFSEYAFNKSHAAAYAIVAYQTAYLKTFYKLEFFASLLTQSIGNTDDIKLYIKECISNGITIIGPDVNLSIWEFKELRKDNKEYIIFGFGGIKGFGEAFARIIEEDRNLKGKFLSFDDFINRLIHYEEFKKSGVEILIKAGAFNSLNKNGDPLKFKALYLNKLDEIIKNIEEKIEEEKIGNINLFDNSHEIVYNYNEKEIKPLSLNEDFINELEVFGFYLSNNLFNYYKKKYGYISNIDNYIINNLKKGTNVLISGIITEINNKIASNNKPYINFVIDNGIDQIKFIIFNEKIDKYKKIITINNFVYIKSQLTEGITKQLDLLSINPIDGIINEKFTELHIFLDLYNNNEETILENLKSFKDSLEKNNNQGIIKVIFHIFKNNQIFDIYCSDKYRIKFSNEIIEKIKNLNSVRGFWLF